MRLLFVLEGLRERLLSAPRVLEGALSLLFVTGVALLAVVAAIVHHAVSIPLLVVFGWILFNSFFSVRILLALQLHTLFHALSDLALMLLYIAMAWGIGRPVLFLTAVAGLFTVAALKYRMVPRSKGRRSYLRDKTFVNIVGALGGIATMLAMFILGPKIAFVLFAAGFSAVQPWIFMVRRLYRFTAADR